MAILDHFKSVDELRQQQEPDQPKFDSIAYLKVNSVFLKCKSDDLEWGDPEPESETNFCGTDFKGNLRKGRN